MTLEFLDPATMCLDADGFRISGQDGTRRVQIAIPRSVLDRHLTKSDFRDQMVDSVIIARACNAAYQRSAGQFPKEDKPVLICVEDADFEHSTILEMMRVHNELKAKRVAEDEAAKRRAEGRRAQTSSGSPVSPDAQS